MQVTFAEWAAISCTNKQYSSEKKIHQIDGSVKLKLKTLRSDAECIKMSKS